MHATEVTKKGGSYEFFKAVENRRTIYALKNESPVSNEKIVEIIQKTVKHTPSSFNSQTCRAIVLFGAHHTKLWSIVLETLRGIVSTEAFPASAQRIAGFAAAYGTVLFFENDDGVKKLQEQFASYAQMFPQWSEQSSGMHQFVAWTALEAEGLGANLQHYNPIIDEEVKKEWSIPAGWSLKSQLVFGAKGAEAGEKVFGPIEERVKVFA